MPEKAPPTRVPAPANDASQMADELAKECDAIKELLLAKNSKYGNSALKPKRMFARSGPLEQLAVRVDDKLSRIVNMGGLVAVLQCKADDGEDTVTDLIGYLVLAKVAARMQ